VFFLVTIARDLSLPSLVRGFEIGGYCTSELKAARQQGRKELFKTYDQTLGEQD
jgi:hypothetical protein